MITALCDRRTPDAASAWSNWGKANPPIPSAPILMKLRRDIPSQYLREEALFAKTVSITTYYDERGCNCNHEICSFVPLHFSPRNSSSTQIPCRASVISVPQVGFNRRYCIGLRTKNRWGLLIETVTGLVASASDWPVTLPELKGGSPPQVKTPLTD